MHVPINVFLGLAGLPYSDWEIVAPLAQSIVREPDMAIALQSAEKVLRYLKEKFDERRVAPRDDSLTAIVQSEVFGRNITEEEVLGTGLMLLVGGVDTTPATITFAANIPGETQTLPLAIYSGLQVPGMESDVARLAVLSIALSLLALLASEWLVRRHQGDRAHVL